MNLSNQTEVISKLCEFFQDGKCGLGYHNGKPHEGNCRACIAARENNREHANRIPNFAAQVKSATSAAMRFAKSGFPKTDPDTLSVRIETCRSCDLWDAAVMRGTGRCRKCGCSTWAKLRMASEKCPLGKW
jgi:hypothetical protein